DPMGVQPGAISKPVLRHGGIDRLQVGCAEFLNRNRSNAGGNVLAQELGVTGPGLVAYVVVGPVGEPALDELGDGLGRGIDVQAGAHGGDDLGGLGLRLRLSAVDGDVPGFALAVAGDVVLETPRALASAGEMAFHFGSPSCGPIAVTTAPLMPAWG